MKKFFYYLLIISLFFGGYCNSESLIPLEQYCKENNIDEDISALGYVSLRCSALFFCTAGQISKYLDTHEDNKGEGQKAVYSYLDLSAIFARITAYIWKEKAENVMELQKIMVYSYAEAGNKNFAKTGSYYKGSYIEKDRTICQDLAKKTNVPEKTTRNEQKQ